MSYGCLQKRKIFQSVDHPSPEVFVRKVSFSVWKFISSIPLNPKNFNVLVPPSPFLSPDQDYVVHVDASMTDPLNPSCVAACLRNSVGEWIMGCKRSIMVVDVLMAKLHAIYEGLHLARREHVSNPVLVSDCQKAINRINQEELLHDLYVNMVRECRETLQGFTQVKCMFMKRDWNKVADAMARDGRILGINRNVVRELPHPP